MAEPNFYELLGVAPTASLDEIKSAYRELVKRHHPDLFSNERDKNRANEKLLRINQAYAVLGDPARRREYDERRAARAEPRRRAAAPTPPRKPAASARARPSGRSSVRTRTGLRWQSPLRNPRVVSVLSKAALSRRTILLLVAIAAGALLLNATREQPQAVLAWTLLSETLVEPSAGASEVKPEARRWNAEGRYRSKLECSSALKERIKSDERQGGRAIFDERLGTIAITVHVRDEEALAREYFEAGLKGAGNSSSGERAVDERELLRQATEQAREFIRRNGLTKRVISYECRPVQVIERNSWLVRKLRELGFLS
ncbi:MAG TPA: J domain-containing protein [Candidatus Eisenbacteria bacterium]|nr:J domain-containing protein [Candidatus Eisenbacteria bacterium]